MSDRIHWNRRVSAAALAILLDACGGGGSSAPEGGVAVVPAPTPSPAPTPTPTPTPDFTPMIGQIFADPLLTADLFAVARGWQYDDQTDQGSFNIQMSEDAGASYDRQSASYRMTIPLLGTGTLFQTAAPYSGDGPPSTYGATVATDAAAAIHHAELYVLKPGLPGVPFSYVSWVTWGTDQSMAGGGHRTSYGVLGLAQPTAGDRVPTTGISHYSGSFVGYMPGTDSDNVVGKMEADFDFGTGSLTGTISFSIACFMGCYHPASDYRLSSVAYARGSATFGGELTSAGAPNAGSFSGRFAGPAGEELIVSIRTPYYNPERSAWTDLSGIALAGQH